MKSDTQAAVAFLKPSSCNIIVTEVKSSHTVAIFPFCIVCLEFWGSSSLCSIQGHL